jgi:hypothetical protein
VCIEFFIFEIDKSYNREYMAEEDFNKGSLGLLDVLATYFIRGRIGGSYE